MVPYLLRSQWYFLQIADLPHFSWSYGSLGKHEKLPSFPSWVTETSESCSQLVRMSQKSGEHFRPSSHICPVHVPTAIPKRERLSGRWATDQRQIYKELRILLNPSWRFSIWLSRTGKVHNFIFPWILCTSHALPSTEDYGLSRTSCQFCKSTLVAMSRVTVNEQWRRHLEQVLLCPFCFPQERTKKSGRSGKIVYSTYWTSHSGGLQEALSVLCPPPGTRNTYPGFWRVIFIAFYLVSVSWA